MAESNCFELSRAEVDRLVIRELRRKHPGALPISIDFEPRTEGGFCHCWWIQGVTADVREPSEENRRREG